MQHKIFWFKICIKDFASNFSSKLYFQKSILTYVKLLKISKISWKTKTKIHCLYINLVLCYVIFLLTFNFKVTIVNINQYQYLYMKRLIIILHVIRGYLQRAQAYSPIDVPVLVVTSTTVCIYKCVIVTATSNLSLTPTAPSKTYSHAIHIISFAVVWTIKEKTQTDYPK